MKLRLALALCALTSPALSQSLPTPNLGTGTKLNGASLTTTATKGQGTSVADPGTGNLEVLLPVQSVTGASKTFVAADLYKETRRSNSGSAMSDTFPGTGTVGLVNGARMFVNNVDAAAAITISAGSGTTINGVASVVLGPGRSSYWVYDAAATIWRPTGNTLTSLLSANNLSELSSAAAARSNLGLGSIALLNTLASKFIVQGTSDSGLTSAQFLGSLGTGLVKNTTGTGVLSIAGASDYVSPSRQVASTGSITGGGDLSVDRTLAYSGDGAWTPYTPTVSCGTGSVTMSSVAGAYKRLGDKTVAFRVKAVINTNSSCTSFGLTLPFAPNADLSLTGRENVATGQMFGGNAAAGTTTFILFYYNNTHVAANGATFTFGATYDTP